MKDKIRLTLGVLTGAIVLTSLTLSTILWKDHNKTKKQEGTLAFPNAKHLGGYDVNFNEDVDGRRLTLTEPYMKAGNLNSPKIVALDSTLNGLGRIDKIDISTLPRGHLLEHMVSLDKLQTLYDQHWPQARTNYQGGQSE